MTRRPSPKTILDDYITGLLHETNSLPEVGTGSETLDREKQIQLQNLLDQATPVHRAGPHSAPAALPPTYPRMPPTPVRSPATADNASDTVPEAVTRPLQAQGDTGRPDWALCAFDALQFRVAGLNLAVPLIALGQIYPLNDELTSVFGQADWLLGIQPCRQGLLKVVNTARYVMPDRYRDEFGLLATHVISIDGLDWGLAIDSVGQPMRLSPDDVIWRTRRSQRPWLAGTVKAALCALLDVPRMGELFQAADVAQQGSGRADYRS